MPATKDSDTDERPLTFGEIEAAFDALKDAGRIEVGIQEHGRYYRYEKSGDSHEANRENLTRELEAAGLDPSEHLASHTDPGRPSPGPSMARIEKRVTHSGPNILFHGEADPEEMERTELYIDNGQVGTYSYGHGGNHSGRIALKRVVNARNEGGTEWHIGILEMDLPQTRGEKRVEHGFYCFREMHGPSHIWAFIRDFGRCAPFYGNPDERFAEVWGSALVCIENDLL
jgi:hypothetical protein